MKLSFHFLILAVGIFFALSACAENSKNKEISVLINDEEESILVRVNNNSIKEKKLSNLFDFSLDQKESGLFFLIKDENGVEKKLCSMIDKSREVDEILVSEVKPKKNLERRWRKDMLARRYCLFPGRYSLRVYLVQEGKKIGSNEIIYENVHRP